MANPSVNTEDKYKGTGKVGNTIRGALAGFGTAGLGIIIAQNFETSAKWLNKLPIGFIMVSYLSVHR